MTTPAPQFDELGLLTAALCDGEISPSEASRLEHLVAHSEAAQRYFVNYVQLHGELSWESGLMVQAPRLPQEAMQALRPSCETAREMPVPVRRRAAALRRRLAILVTVAAGFALLAFTLWSAGRGRTIAQKSAQPPAVPVVARLIPATNARWKGPQVEQLDLSRRPEGVALHAGQTLTLAEGLAEIAFVAGAHAILAAPACLEVTDSGHAFLRSGSLAAVVPHEASGFTINTPSARVVDLGTEFGVAVEKSGQSEIHVFLGSVTVQPQRGQPQTGRSQESSPRSVLAGQAVRVVPPAPGKVAQVEAIAAGGRRFVRSLAPVEPISGSVARLRQLVDHHPNLIHHYTFEGATLEEKYRDRRGDLDLSEVVMFAGRGGGALNPAAQGFDQSTSAVAPYRGYPAGNSTGVGLQSQGLFTPPPKFTVELLLNFAGSPEGNGTISVAVSTRDDDRNCGFFVVAVDRGQLVHLMDGMAPWVEGEVEFIPGDWYYVASTFSVAEGTTTINSYAANLSRGERKLTWAVKNQVANGAAAPSRLGIGKGFNATVAHAYPWSGALDEVAIYNAVLDPATLEEHLQAILGQPTFKER
jgi:hypothetical protein